MRTVLYTGKGGVGKTTTAAATAVVAASRGHRTLVLSADPAHSLADVFGEPLGPTPRELTRGLAAAEVDARAELDRHWGRIRDYLVALFRHQGVEAGVAEELALLPGVEELAALLAVGTHGQSDRYDLLVVDCAPTDSTLRLVTLPDAARSSLRVLLKLQQAIAAVVTPLAGSVIATPLPRAQVFRDAEALLYRRLGDIGARLRAPQTTVRLVLTPERLVVDEARRAHTDLALFEIACDAVVLNRMLPPEAAGEPFFRDAAAREAELCDEVGSTFAPLPVLRAPLQEDEVVGIARLARHGEALFDGRDPGARLTRRTALRFHSDAGEVRVDLALPHARPEELDVAKVDGALVIRTGRLRRSLPLPRGLRSLRLLGARLERDRLRVRLGASPTG